MNEIIISSLCESIKNLKEEIKQLNSKLLEQGKILQAAFKRNSQLLQDNEHLKKQLEAKEK